MKNNILKSILATILLLLGVSQTASAWDWTDGKTVYFDNAVTQWSSVYVIIGHGSYSRAYKMDPVANTTLYKYTMSPKWGGYDKFVIASTIGNSSLDGNNTSIGDAYGSCTSRINSVSQNVDADILIKVTGTSSIYSRDILTSFDLNDYSTNKLPSANKYYYMGNGIDGAGWGNGKELSVGVPDLYEYIEVSAGSAVEFKITESKNSYTGELNSSNIAGNDSKFKGDVELGGSSNIQIDRQDTKYYILVYYPKTECNTNDKAIISASTTLPASCPSDATYAVTISAGTGGTVSPSGEKQVGSTPVTITAKPSTGYVFDKWTASNENITITNASATTTTITATAAGTVTANFKASSTSVSYYYHDDKNTKWMGDGQVGTANSTEGYVYWSFTKNQYDDNNFKIFNCKPKPADEQEGKIHPNLIGYDDKIDNTLSNGGLTLTDPSGDNWHNIRLPNTSGAYYIVLYLPNSTYNSTAEYKVAIRVTLPGTIAATTYWYFDEKNTGWEGTIANKWKFVDAGNYAYVLVPAKNEENKFKIFTCNPKNDANTYANDGNIATGELAGDITLKNTDSEHHNIVIAPVPSEYYVLLYYPNTSLNTSDKPLVAATYDLPGVQKYAVSFGVVGKTGGTITAKSGSSTITSGQLVSRATFTATPAAGYSVEGWYADAEGTQKIDAAGTNTAYTQAITATNNSVYVKFEKRYALYFKPNAPINWGEAWAYIFGTTNVWDTNNNPSKGVALKGNTSSPNYTEYGQMGKLNDSVYYYNLQTAIDQNIYFALNSSKQSGYEFFWQCEAIYRDDFHKDMPVFIAEKGQVKDDKNVYVNETQYYSKGVWMKFNDTDPGYELGVRNQSTGEMPYYRFAAEKAGDYISTVDVVLTKGITYSFLVRNDKPYYFTPNSETKWTSSNSHFELYNSNNSTEVVIEPDTTGIYTFQLNLANGKVEIDVLYPTTSYRLVYVEKNSGTIKKFHPSHIIKSHPEATAKAPMFDTVSMHVRLKKIGPTPKDTSINSNDCEVWLQEYKEVGSTMNWVNIQEIDAKTQKTITTSGVYNFVIKQAGSSASIDASLTHPYTGRYYIRTDASDGGWSNYKQLSNYCYYSEYSRVYRGFDYYYCHWTEAGINTKYTIACDYSYCVSDTLAQEDHTPHSTFTDANGKLNNKANIRFMWHSFSNELDRAYLAGADDNLYLLSNAGIYDMDGNPNTEAKLSDQQNWVYRVDVKADTRARIKLRAIPYNGATSYSWFRGLDGDFSIANTEQLIEGKAGTRYTIRVIYDFKTDHLICAWIPDKDTITSNDVINADLMIIRTDQGEAAQLNFKPNETKVTNITVAYCVLNLTYDHLNDSKKSSKQRGCYWISFPYDVNLSDVFGCGKYGEDFIIQYYDGAERARKGCWADSPTYWKYITNPTGVVLKKGMGYVLVIDYAKIISEQFKHSNTSVNIYFPSSGPIDAIDGVLPTKVVVPEHECTIKRNDRYIYDSNWNIIGIPTWANIDQFGNPMKAVQSTSELSQGGTATYTIGFYYAHDAVNNKWTVCDTKEVDFLSMYSYLVQWAGTINWKNKVATGEHHPKTLAPRRYAPAAEGVEEAEGAEAPEQYTLRLTLNRGEQQLDHTYIRLQEGNVTTDFDLNYDMTKIINSGANIYSLVGTNLIQCAANVQPLQEEAKTISIPLGVVADQDGLYTFSLPEGTEGMNVSIADSETGMAHNLALGDYQTALTKGTYEGRFALEIQPRQGVSTGCEQTDAAGKSLRKVLINGNLYILRDGKAYTAAGKEL